MNAPRTARDRARAELTRDIKDVARALIERDGAAALSLREVSREMGMGASSLYRYFASRDDLLTALIIDAFDQLGAAAEEADAGARRAGAGHGARWLAAGRAVRAWALAHPHEFALVYGSPVAGYSAPPDTVGPATRITGVLGGDPVGGHRGRGPDASGAPAARPAADPRADPAQLRPAARSVRGRHRARAGAVDRADRDDQLRALRPPE